MNQECGHILTQNIVINCANYLITGSNIVTAMNVFHQSNSKYPTREFGLTWYSKFMIRNKHQLKNRRGDRQHKQTKIWKTNENFIPMYYCVYAAMVNAKITIPLYKS